MATEHDILHEVFDEASSSIRIAGTAVPDVDAILNAYMHHVIGNKGDAASKAAATASLVALLRQVVSEVGVVDGFHDVPSTDSAANAQIRDVMGSKADTHDGDSVYAFVETLLDHFHQAQLVYPTLADGVALATGAGDWELGTITQVVPASTIGMDFDIHEIVVEAANTADKTYELHLFSGAGDTEIARVRFAAGTVRGGVPNVVTQMPIIAADSRIRGRLAIEGGGSKTATISCRYHLY